MALFVPGSTGWAGVEDFSVSVGVGVVRSVSVSIGVSVGVGVSISVGISVGIGVVISRCVFSPENWSQVSAVAFFASVVNPFISSRAVYTLAVE